MSTEHLPSPPLIERESSETLCSICLEAFDERVDTKCGHSYCRRCIFSVLQTSEPVNMAPCPFCRAPVRARDLVHHESGARLVSAPVSLHDAISATLGGSWFGDPRYIPKIRAADAIRGEAFHVRSVCWFDCGGTMTLPAGSFDFSIRVKRLQGLDFPSEVMLHVDGEVIRTIEMRQALSHTVGWQLLNVGSLHLEHPREVKVGMYARDGSWKGGLLLDSVMALPSGAQLYDPAVLFHFDDSGRWLVRWEDGNAEPITLANGSWTIFGTPYQLLDTDPVTFTWMIDGTVQTLESYDGSTITWTTSNPLYPYIYWDRLGLSTSVSLGVEHSGPRSCVLM